jgi:DNA replication and repair protein RecF
VSLNSIKILNFRNYNRIELGGFGKFNIFTGINGSGKTNFLEAVFTLSQGKPFRRVPMEDLIEWESTSFYIGGFFGDTKKEIGFNLQKKVLRENSVSVSGGDYGFLSPVVVFLPDDTAIVSGSPDERRSFMDRTLSLLDRDYAESLLLFQKVLKQRNAQLKLSPRDVHIWDEDFIRYGSLLIEKRLLFMQNIGSKIKTIYSEFYGDEVELKYYNTFKIEGDIRRSFIRALEENKPLEYKRRISIAGPHRDNFEIRKLDKRSRSFASQGQTRLLALALKLSLLEDLSKKTSNTPILLLDDVLLELDEKSRSKFLEKTTGYQTFLTTTSLDLFRSPEGLENIFFVDRGSIKPQ